MFDMLKTRRSWELVLIDFPWIVYNPPIPWIVDNSPFPGVRFPCLMPGRAFMYNVPFEQHFGNGGFAKISRTFLDDPSLAFAKVLPAEVIEKTFQKYDGLFGGKFFNCVFVLWAFLSQVLSDDKHRSCATAVSRIAMFCMAIGKEPPDSDNGNYCRARQKLSSQALHELVTLVAKNTESIASPAWLWQDKHHAKLVDGFTSTMPDTPKNQAKYPQHKKQVSGCGFPIMRVCVVLSLATAMVLDAAFAKYEGKETGESALLREMFSAFDSGDIAVFDRYCCSYMMIALFQNRGVHVCTRINAQRRADFRQGKRLGKYDRLVTWQRPQRPAWMSADQYETIPETMQLRMIRYSLTGKGRRSKSITVVTTLADPKQYSAASIAELYGHRWNVELDIRQIKRTLNMDHFRCKSPEMVERELWTTLLGYNLVRKVMCEAANFCGVLPRRLSFTSTCAFLMEAWLMWSLFGPPPEILQHALKYLGSLTVPDRPDRFEPRVIKRRLYRYPLMKKPRHVLKNIQRINLS